MMIVECRSHPHKSVAVVKFASMLTKDMLENTFSKQLPSDEALTIDAEDDGIESFASSVPATPSQPPPPGSGFARYSHLFLCKDM